MTAQLSLAFESSPPNSANKSHAGQYQERNTSYQILARAIPVPGYESTNQEQQDQPQKPVTGEPDPQELGVIKPVIINNTLQYYEKEKAFVSDPINSGQVNFYYNSWRLMSGKISFEINPAELPPGEPFFVEFVWAGFSNPDRTWVTVLYNNRKLNTTPHPVRGHAWGNPEKFILKVRPTDSDYERDTGTLTLVLKTQSSMVLFMKSIRLLRHSDRTGVVSDIK